MVTAVLVAHLFGVIFWIGSLLTITIFMGSVPDEVGVAKERFIIASRQLLGRTGNIGAALAIGFGIAMLFLRPEVLRHSWIYFKLLLAAGLLLLHLYIFRRMTELESSPSSVTSREWRILHGVISALLLGMLILTLGRPF